MHKNIKYILWIIILIVTIICGAILIDGHKQENQAINNNKKQQLITRNWQYKDSENQSNISNKFAQYMKNSKNPIEQSINMNASNNSVIQKPLTRFFTVFYNWNNTNDYTARPSKLQNVASPELLSNKKIFDNGLDKSGESYIAMLQVHSQFNNIKIQTLSANNFHIIAEVNVTYNSWDSGDSKKTGETLYKVTYDRLSNKITGLKRIYNISNIQDSNH